KLQGVSVSAIDGKQDMFDAGRIGAAEAVGKYFRAVAFAPRRRHDAEVNHLPQGGIVLREQQHPHVGFAVAIQMPATWREVSAVLMAGDRLIDTSQAVEL